MRSFLQRILRRGCRSRGQSLAEFALITPLLLVLFAAAGDLGRAFYGYVAIENAAKEGAFFGSRQPICDDSSAVGCTDPNNVVWRVQNELSGIRNPNGTAITPTSECVIGGTNTVRSNVKDCVEGDTYRVTVVYPFRLITPILGNLFGSGPTLRSQAVAVVTNQAVDLSPGVSVEKLVLASTARNGQQIADDCLEPDDQPSPGYYRSSCRNTNDNNNPIFLEYETDDTITYKVTVTNSGAKRLTGVTMVDSQGWPSSCGPRPSVLNVGASYTCTYIRKAPSPPAGNNSSQFINVLTVDADQINAAQDQITVVTKRPPPQLGVAVAVSAFQKGSDGDGQPVPPGFGTQTTITIGTNTTITNEGVWYRILVTNNGGQTATGVTLTDTNGPLPFGSADCPTLPTTLAAQASYVCLYQRLFPNPEVRTNTVTARSSNSVPTTATTTATVSANACSGSNRVVPNLIGLVKASAQTAWTNAGFTTALNVWGGNASSTVVTQSIQAFGCTTQTSSMTVTRTPT
jgi:uncharacterized repeat protein (TIGR01451 family)